MTDVESYHAAADSSNGAVDSVPDFLHLHDSSCLSAMDNPYYRHSWW